MTQPDFRALCAELLDKYDLEWRARELIKAALAAPPPEPPTDKELNRLLYYEFSTSTGHGECVDMLGFARAVLERWGNQATITQTHND